MPTLQQLLGKEDRFFELLEASAKEGRQSVAALSRLLQNPTQTPNLDEFVVARRNCKAITMEMDQELCTNFVTALEREDIEALSACLYRIPKSMEKIAERIQLAPALLQGVDLSSQAKILDQAVGGVLQMINAVRQGAKWTSIKEQNNALQVLEGDADKIVLKLLKDIYTCQHDAGRVVFLKDMYEMLEKAIDRCRDAGNILCQIVLKNM
jgi:uncharacterized protein Yka (UPF0111/DUF47 family)